MGMLNMLEQYYNFLAERAINWLSNQKEINPADKFFVLLEDKEEAENFYSALNKLSYSSKTRFSSEKYAYSTIGYQKQDTNILFVAPINTITQDFLVTVRNRVNENSGDWENTAVFFVVYDALDSIIGGSYDMSQKDAPFNVNTIRKDIEREINNNSEIKESEKDFLTSYLNDITQSTNSSLRDYEIIFNALSNKTIEKNDYANMGFFPDSSLDSLQKKERLKRIERNKESFNEIENFHALFEPREKIEDYVIGDTLINKLSKGDSWKETDYKEVINGLNKKDEQKSTKVEFSEDMLTTDDSDEWLRLAGKTATKRKKLFVLLSNHHEETNLSYSVKFDSNVKRAFVVETNTFLLSENGQVKDSMVYSTSGKNLNLNFKELDPNQSYGGKITYKHNNVPRLKFEILFMIVPFKLEGIKQLKPNYSIEVLKSKKEFYFKISNDVPSYTFGDDIKEVLSITDINSLDIPELLNKELTITDVDMDNNGDSSDIRLKTYYQNYFFPISLSDVIDKPLPASPITIERVRLGAAEELRYEDQKIFTGSQVISVEENYKSILNMERKIVKEKILYSKILSDDFLKVELALPEELEQSYIELFNYYEANNTLPSLAINSDDHIRLLKKIEKEVNKHLSNIQEDYSVDPVLRNILKIGCIVENDDIKLSPLHPLLISYQVELHEQISKEHSIPKENILSTLHPGYLAPYLKLSNKQYQSSYTKNAPRWLTFNELEERPISDLGINIISSRIEDYLSQYRYLFNTNSELALNISAINIVDEENFFSAVIRFFFNRMTQVKRLEDINPINIYFDKISPKMGSLFGRLYELTQLDQLSELTNEKLKNTQFSDYEILELLQEKINIFNLNEVDTVPYFHITFYQFIQLKEVNIYKNDNISKNYSMNGLLSTPQFSKDKGKYLNGFGVGSFVEDNPSNLVKTTARLNSVAAASNTDSDIYSANNTLVNYLKLLEYSDLKSTIDNSSWVTFLNLDVDLSYFFNENNGELLIIHYTDQSTTSQYESITVTNDVSQYDFLIRETLPKVTTDKDYFDTKEIIKNFNVLNGQWLLKMISNSKNQSNYNYLREKMSIISAYKQLLGILQHDHFIWIPVSLEEILRVSGMVGFSQKEGLFSTRNLGKSGSASDDLLFMGIDTRDDELNIHLLPVEVKVGQNKNNVTIKAIEQVKNTSDIFDEYITEKNEDTFMRDYYQNFFVSIMITNLKKIKSSGLISNHKTIEFDQLKDRLILGDYTFSDSLKSYYGNGIVFEFTNGVHYRETQMISEHNVMLIKVPETDAYDLVSEPIDLLIDKIQSNQFDYSSSVLLKNLLNNSSPGEDTQTESTESDNSNELDRNNKNDSGTHVNDTDDTVDDSGEKYSEETEDKDSAIKGLHPKLQDKRLLIGEHLNSNNSIYWEYGHPNLSNRHMVITGKSGQGKTYFIQTMLAELSSSNINSLILDYTDGFMANQLEEKFVESFSSKIDQKIIYSTKLPINPFKLQDLEINGLSFPETIQDMTDRIVQIIDFVFELGIQQRSVLSESIMEGYKVNGESYTFTHLKNDLVYSEDAARRNLYGRISGLLNRDPFSYTNDFNWDDVFGNDGSINVFQFAGFQSNIQIVMLEFLLWDIFQYAKNGDESKPLPIILDEIQNLNFNSSSPVVKILREGRKYGLSGLFATQSLTSIKGNDSESIYNAAEQVHFLPPDNQIVPISKMISSNKSERLDIEDQLKRLHKGEAIVYGPILSEDGSLTMPMKHLTKITSFENRNI